MLDILIVAFGCFWVFAAVYNWIWLSRRRGRDEVRRIVEDVSRRHPATPPESPIPPKT